MLRIRHLATAVVLGTLPVPALADLSAEDVWQSWVDYMESYGYVVEAASDTTISNKLIIRGMSMELPVPDMQTRFSVDWIEFEELGDGSVSITMSPDMPFVMSTTNADLPETDVSAIFRQEGLTMIASGDPEDITYAYSAEFLTMDFDTFVIEGETVEPEVELEMSGLEGSTNVKQGDPWELTSTTTIGQVDFAMAFEDPDDGSQIDVTMNVSDLTTFTDGLMPNEVDLEDPMWPFNSEMAVRGRMTNGPSNFSMTASGAENFSLSGSSSGGELDFQMGEGRIRYVVGSNDAEYTFASDEMPFPPVQVKFGQIGFELDMPITATQEPEDFTFVTRIAALEVDEFLWSLFDPQKSLPRDPASLTIDTRGMARMPENMFDPDAMMAGEDDVEPEIHQLEIRELSLSMLGASASGQGEFTFDNDDMVTFDGMPAPDGGMAFELRGIHELIDNLIGLGVLPEEQAVGARMMLGLFTRPGDEEGLLISEIAVTSDGSVSVNGQRMR